MSIDSLRKHPYGTIRGGFAPGCLTPRVRLCHIFGTSTVTSFEVSAVACLVSRGIKVGNDGSKESNGTQQSAALPCLSVCLCLAGYTCYRQTLTGRAHHSAAAANDVLPLGNGYMRTAKHKYSGLKLFGRIERFTEFIGNTEITLQSPISCANIPAQPRVPSSRV